MLFSALLREAIDSVEGEVPEAAREQIFEQVQDFLQAWIAIHEPDADPDNLEDPQRALILQLMDELEDRIPIPVDSLG